MPFVSRDAEGRISAVAAEPTAAANEAIDAEAPELQAFLMRLSPSGSNDLARTDLGLIRVVEDLIETLMDKNVLRFTDLPEAAQQKLVARRSLRKSLDSLSLFGDAPPMIKL
jgi:hypothetical protein